MKKILLGALAALLPLIASSQTTIQGKYLVDHTVPLAKTVALSPGTVPCVLAGDSSGALTDCTGTQTRAAIGGAASGANADITSLTNVSANGIPGASVAAADGTHQGTVSTGAQTFAGTKTFASIIADMSNSLTTALGGSAALTDAARFAQNLNVVDYGAKGNALAYPDGIISASSASFASASATFTAADIGKTIQIDGASGVNSPPLITTVSTFVDSHHITLANSASVSTPLNYMAVPTVAVSGATGSYVPGDTFSITGGTSTTSAVGLVETTQLRTATVAAAGSGGTTGACLLTGTTGTGQKFIINSTIAAGVISALGSALVPGAYLTNPASLAAEPVTSNCGLTGATLTVTMGIGIASVSNQGAYSALPTNPAATGAGSNSGATGATVNVTWNPTGNFVYGTDNNAAFVATANAVIARNNAGVQSYMYVPQGNYYIGGANTIPLFDTTGGGVLGDGSNKSQITVGAAYNGDLFSWSEAWIASSIPFKVVTPISRVNAFPKVQGISIHGDRRTAFQQNALMFYDRNDFITLDDVTILYMKGQCFATGILKNQTSSFAREGRLTGLRCDNDGITGLPVVDFNAIGGDGTNSIKVSALDIYSPYGSAGLAVRNSGSATGGISFSQVRVEGMEWDADNIAGDLVQIGDPTETGQVSNITFTDMELADPYLGHAAFRVVAPSINSQPFLISVNGGDIGGGLPLGYGLKIDSGRDLYFHLNFIGTINSNVFVGPSSSVGAPIVIDLSNTEASTTFNVDSSSLGSVKIPLVVSQADGTVNAAPFGATHFVKIFGAGPNQNAHIGGSDNNYFDLTTIDGPVIRLLDPNQTGVDSPWIFSPGKTGAFGAEMTGLAPRIQSEDTNPILFATNAGSGGGPGGAIQFGIEHVASAVDYLQAFGAATANPAAVGLQATGTDSNIGVYLIPKGTGTVIAGGNLTFNSSNSIITATGGSPLGLASHVSGAYGSIPALAGTGCAATSGIDNSDSRGSITATAATSCTETFVSAYTTKPICTASTTSTTIPVAVSATTTVLTLTSASLTGGIVWRCEQ